MNNPEIIAATEAYVREVLEGEGSGHDWWHIKRVHDVAVTLSNAYPEADSFIVKMAALLHDIGDHKFYDGDHTVGPRMVREWLEKYDVRAEDVDHIVSIVKQISFKGAGVATPMSTLEGEIVQDADRLDAIGAIGIARTFAYGGNKNREIYNPNFKIEEHNDFESYKKTQGPTINHFYEKLLLLKDRMNTSEGKKMAEERHAFMESYLEQFYAEWEGRK